MSPACCQLQAIFDDIASHNSSVLLAYCQPFFGCDVDSLLPALFDVPVFCHLILAQ